MNFKIILKDSVWSTDLSIGLILFIYSNLPEYGFRFSDENVVTMVRSLFERILGLEMRKANAYAGVEGLEYKLVYDPSKNSAWAYWIENSDEAMMTPPISYADLVSKTGINFHLPIQTESTQDHSMPAKPNTSITRQNASLVGGWYPIFFDAYSAEKVNAILNNIKAGKVASVQIQYDQNAELAKQIASQLQSQTQAVIDLSQSSPPDTPGVTYERKRVTAIVRSKAN